MTHFVGLRYLLLTMLIPILCVSSALRPGPAPPSWLSGLKFETREVHSEDTHRQTASPANHGRSRQLGPGAAIARGLQSQFS